MKMRKKVAASAVMKAVVWLWYGGRWCGHGMEGGGAGCVEDSCVARALCVFVCVWSLCVFV